MKKKVLSVLLTAAMALSLVACGGKTAAKGSGNITIWVADNVVDFTKEKAEKFLSESDLYSGYTVTVEAVGEGDAAGNMITDVDGGADIFGFAQDQLARLVSAGAVMPITGDYATWVKDQNAGGAVAGASTGDQIYAFPMTADNGYFLYYDKSVISDPSSLESILADCEAAGKNFYFDLGSWYHVAFFFGAGCECYYDTDNDGNFTGVHVDYASENGLAALKALIKMVESPAYQAGSSVDNAVEWAGIIDGTWDKNSAMTVLGDNYACAKCPTFTVDGKTYQMGGFNGMKLMGIKPQTDSNKLQACLALTQYLTGSDVQLERFKEFGWGPSNVTAQNDAAVQADPALSALAAQFEYTVPQGNYPGDFWNTGLDGDLQSGVLNSSMSDADLMAYLSKLQSFLEAAK